MRQGKAMLVWCWYQLHVTSLQAFGDYKVNGLGHSYVNLGDGCSGILVPGRRVWKVKREHVQSAAVVEQVDDGSFQLGSEAQLADMMTDIAANFVGQAATGVSIAELTREHTLSSPGRHDMLPAGSPPVAALPSFSLFGQYLVGPRPAAGFVPKPAAQGVSQAAPPPSTRRTAGSSGETTPPKTSPAERSPSEHQGRGAKPGGMGRPRRCNDVERVYGDIY